MNTIVHTDNPGRLWTSRRTQHQRRYTGARPAAYPSSTRPRHPVLPCWSDVRLIISLPWFSPGLGCQNAALAV